MDLYEVRKELGSGKSVYDLPLRVSYYARVSTDKDEQLHSLSAQVMYYEDFIKSVPKWTFVNGYIDEGISGTSVHKRESFMRMIDDARLRKFDFLVTKEISRFSRNTVDSIQYTQELLHYNVGVLFQSDNINTLMPDSELRLTIMASIAQDEVRKLSERVKFGFKRSQEKGVVLGNSKIWGYEKDNGKLVIVEKQAQMVREIFDMYANQKLGIRRIAQELNAKGFINTKGNPFTFTTIRGILANPKYKGFYCGNKTSKLDYRRNERKYLNEDDWLMYKDEERVPPIVSEELWDKVNSLLEARAQKQSSEDKSSYQNKYKYSGKIICGEHNTPYYRALYRYKSGDREVWHCKQYGEKGKSGCDMPVIYTNELDAVIKEVYDAIIVNKTTIINDLIKIYSEIGETSKIASDKAKTEVEISKLLAKKDKLLDLLVDNRLSNDEFELRNRDFNVQIDKLKTRHKDLEDQERRNKALSSEIEQLRASIANELNFEDGFDANIIDSLIDKIIVYKTEDKNVIGLKVYLKILHGAWEYHLNKGRKNTSVCYIQHT